MIRRTKGLPRSSRVEPLETRLLLHAGHDHPAPTAESTEPAPSAPPSADIFSAAVGTPLSPDLFPLSSESRGYIHGWTYDTTTLPGRTLLRLSTAVANQGRGALELRGGTVNQDGTQNVNQRIFKEGGGYTDRLAGTFTHHAAHQHIHFDNFATYRLRHVTQDDGVGAAVASGQKISFCLLDIDHFDAALSGSPAGARYNTCAQVQGISVGWSDVYDKSLPDQWIDVTDTPNGRYWIEVTADPDNRLQESDETNNSVRVLIDLAKPSDHPTVVSHNPSGQFPGQASFVEFVFSQSMSAPSLDLDEDVASFTGPGGEDLFDAITGAAWTDARTLRVSFRPQSAAGTYTMRLGPEIAAADTGTEMDQDADDRPGEAQQDQYVATFSLVNSLGPDGFGYEARQTAAESVDLVPGAAGVVTLLDDADDNSAPIDLGDNTFSFYGTTYTGDATLYASSNGLITFGGGDNEYDNADLSEDPTLPAIAPLWDDWRTTEDGADTVLYRFENTTGDARPDRLVIEWSNVNPYSSDAESPSAVTFQAILQLNTGAAPGAIVFNYRDLNTGDPDSTNGAGATIGIKAGGVQGSNRLVVSHDRANHPFVAGGRAIRIERLPATVAARHLFYNRSAFDGRAAAANAADDNAVATDKSPLLPGQPATAANVSSYVRGINGVMVDLANLGTRTPALADFTFKAGGKTVRGKSASGWTSAPPPASITVRRGAGAGGSDRVVLTWSDKSIRNQWLQVTVNATPNTMLAAPDVFYFGSLIGETAAGLIQLQVSPVDVKQTRHALRTRTAAITHPADHNRDGRIDARDVNAARSNLLRSIAVLTSASTSGTSAPISAAPQAVVGAALTRNDGSITEAVLG